MKLATVNIKNFRSIKDQDISFEPRARILVGINESGKSNLLSALSLLDMRSPIRREDIRFALPSEDPIQESKVTFYFQIQNEDLEALTDSIESEILSEESDKPLFPDKRIKTLTDLIKAHKMF
jgi:predicted ATP-dependent endonuclease of OLD family